MTRACSRCEWWDREHTSDRDDYHHAACRVGAPRTGGLDMWPHTTAGAWCQGFTPIGPAQQANQDLKDLLQDVGKKLTEIQHRFGG